MTEPAFLAHGVTAKVLAELERDSLVTLSTACGRTPIRGQAVGFLLVAAGARVAEKAAEEAAKKGSK